MRPVLVVEVLEFPQRVQEVALVPDERDSSGPEAATTAPSCECIIWCEAGANQKDCCECSEGFSKHGRFSCHACGPNNASRAAISTPEQSSTKSGRRLDLDQRSGDFGNHDDWAGFDLRTRVIPHRPARLR